MPSSEPTLWDASRPFDRALVVVAHPDDAEFGAAGTVARWTALGTAVRYLVLTDGASGSGDPAMTRARLAALRAEEQRAACAVLGVEALEFLGYGDGYLEPTITARRAVAAAIRRHRPQVIVTLNPEMRWSPTGYVNHPDHRATGDLVLHSLNPAASTRLWDPSLLDEGLEPWDVAELWLMDFAGGLALVDVTATFDAKVEALRCHASQLGDWDPEPFLRAEAERRGAEVGVALAEGFTRLVLRAEDDAVPGDRAITEAERAPLSRPALRGE